MLQVIVTRILLGSYYSTRRRLTGAPQSGGDALFGERARRDGLQQHLIQSLYHPNVVNSLLTEHPETEAKRVAAKAKYSALSAAAARSPPCPPRSPARREVGH